MSHSFLGLPRCLLEADQHQERDLKGTEPLGIWPLVEGWLGTQESCLPTHVPKFCHHLPQFLGLVNLQETSSEKMERHHWRPGMMTSPLVRGGFSWQPRFLKPNFPTILPQTNMEAPRRRL